MLSHLNFTFKYTELDSLSTLIFGLCYRLEFAYDDYLPTMSFLKGYVSLLPRFLMYVVIYIFACFICVYIDTFICMNKLYICQLYLKRLALYISNKTVVLLGIKAFTIFFVILYYFITKHCLVIFMETRLKIYNVWWSMCTIICLGHVNHTK